MPVHALMAAIHEAEGIPPETQRLVWGSRDLRPTDFLSGPLPRVTLCLRVAGGKGGFGAMLRGKSLAAGQKKTTNFDACRDLNGVRLKAVHQDRQIAEWRARQAAKHESKQQSRKAVDEPPPPLLDSPTAAFDLDGYYEANESARACVATAVSAGLATKRQRDVLGAAVREAAEAVEASASDGSPSAAVDGARASKAPRVDAPAAAPGGERKGAVGARWSVLERPSDDSDDSSADG